MPNREDPQGPVAGLADVNVTTLIGNTCGNVIDSGLLKQDVEVKLRVAGIKIAEDSITQLNAIVNCAHLDSDGERIVTALYVSLALYQVVLVAPEGKRLGVGTTWNQDNVFACGFRQKCDELIRKTMRDYADGFVNDYLEMNPKN